MDSSNFKVVCDHCDAKLASVFCHSDGAFLCPQCDAQVHSVNKLAQRHLRVPCQSCPVWAYREAKSRGRLLDMPLAACLTKNLHLDVFDGASACWPSKNASSVAMGTPQSDASSPQATTAAPLVNAGSPNSEVHATAFHQPSNSWSQNSALAMVTSQPQPMPQPSLGCLSMSQGMEPAEGARAAAALFSISPFSACSGGSLQAAANAAVQRPPQPGPERCSVQGVQASTTTTTAAATAAPPPPQQQQQHISQAAQSQHSQHTLQRAASQELMDAVDSMDVAMLLDTFGAPLDQLQDNSNKRNGDAVQQQQQQQQSQVLPQQESSAQQQQFMAATQQQQQIVAAELLQSQASAMCMTSMPSAAVAATGGAAAAAGAPATLGNTLNMSSVWAPLAHQAQVQQQQQQQHTLFQQQQQLLQEQLQQQQRQVQVNAAAIAAAAAGCLAQPSAFAVQLSEPMAVPTQQRQQITTARSLSGLSCLSQSGLSSNNTDGQQLGSARSSNTLLLQSLDQQMTGMATCGLPMMTVAGPMAPTSGGGGGAGVGAAAAGWASIEATQRQLQQLQQQQQQTALQYLQQKQQQQQVAAALAAAQQQQQQQKQAMQQLLQRAMTEDLPRTSPISIGTAAGGVTAFASARRDATVRGGLGLLDPGIGRGRSLAQSPMSLLPVPGTAFASSSCSLLDNLSGSGMNPSSIAAVAAAAAGRVAPGNPFGVGLLPGAAPGGPTAAMAAAAAAAPQPLPGARSLDAAAASSFGALPTSVVGSGGSTSVSPSNCNTLAGAVAERHVPLTAQQLAQQMVLPGSAPPALGLAASVTMGSCDLSESHLMRMSSDGFDGLIGAAATVTGNSLGNSLGMLGLDSDAAGLLTLLERPDGTLKELDPERAAQLNRQKRMLRMRALAEGAKKVRYECRKQMADTRPRVRGRFAKVNSSDTLLEFGSAACLPASSSGNNATTTGSVASASACTAPAGVAFHGPGGSGGSGGGGGGGWGLHGHHAHAAPQPHMQRIDEEGISEGQSPLVLPTAGSFPMRQASSSSQEAGTGPGPAGGAATSEGATATATEAAAAAAAGALGAVCGFTSAMITDQARVEPQQQQQQLLLQDCSQRLQRAQSSSMADVARMVDSMQTGLLGSCNNTANTCSTTVIATGAAAAAQGGLGAAGHDCDITEHDLAALGFDELPQLSGGLSNGGHSMNEDMDESAESMNDGVSTMPDCVPVPGARPPSVLQPSGQVVVMQHTTGVQNPSGALQPPPSSAALPQHQHQHQLQVLGPQQLLAAPQSLPAIASACFLQQAQHQHIQTQPLAPPPPQQQLQPRLSVLDRPIMYGTDRSQFSAAQLSLLDSILTDQYRPSSGGAAAIGRH